MTAADRTFETELETWRAQRLKALTSEDGWLSVCGLIWIEPGRWRFGSAQDNDILIEKLPPHAGVLTLDDDGSARVALSAAGGTIGGEAVPEGPLVDDRDAARPPTRVAFGTVSFHLIDREGRKALRARDSESPIRTGFAGLDHFDADPAFRIEADWVAVDPPRVFEVDSIVGISSTVAVTHKAVFYHDGAQYTLWPTHGSAAAPMFVLRDTTAGKETYGAARFLSGFFEEDRPGRIVLDFNRAINPPCAFTPAATCPLPPEENRLPFPIRAGEKKPRD
ncbi:DUF1684 domain-containing protein [Rhizobiaceae bacterium BDR2-2]|uniref:DUF1684 domain-containing protein n=1 Tax=Ectorhizobium quercum TaxID=2965071 RepID=A0AAE3N3Z6_9HYPH|nr:DUF1684 domain-containing protein [Ectorhizobium quercum]MCX8998072.1 DUF1684 domain-containing protein [Ectorhizobium quercum]